jgi:hypothetical protein
MCARRRVNDVTARKGTQRAWLAPLNLDQNLRKHQGRVRHDAR